MGQIIVRYKDGSIVGFKFRPNSLDVSGKETELKGVITGIMHEDDGIFYKVQIRDNKRNIHGDVIVPEKEILYAEI